jgi:hypothetical protein
MKPNGANAFGMALLGFGSLNPTYEGWKRPEDEILCLGKGCFEALASRFVS